MSLCYFDLCYSEFSPSKHVYSVQIKFWNEVPYTRVEQGTYSTENETLSLPWPYAVRGTYAERTYPKPADSVSAIKEKPSILSHTSTDI